jgi:hypothetical protein
MHFRIDASNSLLQFVATNTYSLFLKSGSSHNGGWLENCFKYGGKGTFRHA